MADAAPRGIFITFEGIDGAGKSSHIEALCATLRKSGRTVTLTREPGGTPLAEQLRELVLHTAMDGLTEALLVFAGRRHHLVNVIEPALARGDVVVCDRFTDSTFAYQGGGQGQPLEMLATLERWVQSVPGHELEGLRQPDLTLWFDLPAAVAAARLAQARSPDRFEARDTAFFARVAQGYAARASADPERFVRVRADALREQVWSEVHAAVRARGWAP